MFSKSAELYDRIYSEFKDYQAESTKIHDLISRECPSGRTLLDVACGTGEHARLLAEQHGYHVDGIDLDEKLLALARRKVPGGVFRCVDMADFDLGKTYDVVMCLFSSIGYLKTLKRVTEALARFKAHIQDDGMILVEPWFQPNGYHPGRTFLNTAQSSDLKVARMGTSQVEGRISTLRFEYLIGTHGAICHEVEEHELGLFTVDEMKKCFGDAGLKVKYDSEGPSGRGLYLARKE